MNSKSLNTVADEMTFFARAFVVLSATAACCSISWFVYRDSVTRASLTDPAEPKQKVAVEVMSVEEGVIREELPLVGSLVAQHKAEIRARVAGYITAMPFHIGDSVGVGATVVQLDEAAAREVIASAEAELLVVEAERRAKMAELELAQRRLQRQQKLVHSSAGTRSELDAVDSDYKVAEARVALADARVTRAESALNQAKLALEDLRLPSPISGVVANRLADIGELATTDVGLVEIINLDDLETVVHVVERDYTKIQRQDTAEIHVDAFPERTFEGSVCRIRPLIDRETLTAAVHIRVPNESHLLKPGMHARVVLRLGDPRPRSVIPLAAVVRRGLESSVFVVKGEPPVAQRRMVTLGTQNSTEIEILSGIETGERVVTLGHRLLKDGQQVRVLQASGGASDEISAEASSATALAPTRANLASQRRGNRRN